LVWRAFVLPVCGFTRFGSPTRLAWLQRRARYQFAAATSHGYPARYIYPFIRSPHLLLHVYVCWCVAHCLYAHIWFTVRYALLLLPAYLLHSPVVTVRLPCSDFVTHCVVTHRFRLHCHCCSAHTHVCCYVAAVLPLFAFYPVGLFRAVRFGLLHAVVVYTPRCPRATFPVRPTFPSSHFAFVPVYVCWVCSCGLVSSGSHLYVTCVVLLPTHPARARLAPHLPACLRAFLPCTDVTWITLLRGLVCSYRFRLRSVRFVPGFTRRYDLPVAARFATTGSGLVYRFGSTLRSADTPLVLPWLFTQHGSYLPGYGLRSRTRCTGFYRVVAILVLAPTYGSCYGLFADLPTVPTSGSTPHTWFTRAYILILVVAQLPGLRFAASTRFAVTLRALPGLPYRTRFFCFRCTVPHTRFAP